MKVLIADDDAVQMLRLVRMVRAAGHDADGAADAVDALALLSAARYDAAVVDYVLGAASGLDVVRAACAAGARGVLMSAVPPGVLADGVAALAREGHAVAMLQKPFDAGELLALLGAAEG